LKEGTLDHTVCRIRLERGYGCVIRQTAECPSCCPC